MTKVTELARPCILRRKEYIPGKPVEEVKRELGLCDIIKIASNENPLGTSPKALEAMIQELRDSANRYPESLCYDLTNRLSALHHLSPDHFVLDNGADGIISLLGLAFLCPGEEVIVGDITFSAYENMVDTLDGVTVKAPMTPDYRLDLDAMLAAVTPRTKMMFLCNPNNPTGTIVTQDEFDRLLERLPEHVLLIVDEAYAEFADDPAFAQAIPLVATHPNLVVMRTFSKIMGLAGLRIGYAVADPEVCNLLLKAREPFSVNRIAQAGALAAMDDDEFIQRTIETNRAGREQLYRGLDALDLHYIKGQANFVLVELGRPVQPVYQALLREGVIIRPLNSFGLPNALRVSVSTEEENARFLTALEKVLAQEGDDGQDRRPEGL